MLTAVLAGVGLAIRAVLPVILPPIMAHLDKKLPDSGKGPQRKDAVMRAVMALSDSLMNDGVIDSAERQSLLSQADRVIEAFVPTINAQKDGPVGRVQVKGGYLEIA